MKSSTLPVIRQEHSGSEESSEDAESLPSTQGSEVQKGSPRRWTILSKLRRESLPTDYEDDSNNKQSKEKHQNFNNMEDVTIKSDMSSESIHIVENRRSFVAIKSTKFSKGTVFENISKLTTMAEQNDNVVNWEEGSYKNALAAVYKR